MAAPASTFSTIESSDFNKAAAVKPRKRARGAEEVMEQRTVDLEHQLGAVEVGRRQPRLLQQRPALALAKQPRRVGGGLHESAPVMHEAGIERAFEGHGADPGHQQRRRGGDDREQRDDLDMQLRPGDPGAARPVEGPGLDQDKTEDDKNAGHIGDEEAKEDRVGRRDRGEAGENKEAAKREQQHQNDGGGAETDRESTVARGS